MGPIVDSYSQPIHQLSPEPASHKCQRDGNETKYKRSYRWVSWIGLTEKPADDEQDSDNDVSGTMPQSDVFRPCSSWDCDPID